MSKREQILAAIKTLVASVTDLETVTRGRPSAFARDELPAANIIPISDTPDQPSLPRLQWSLIVRIVVQVRAATEADSAVDPFLEDIHAALMADVSLGGLVMDVQPVSTAFQLADSDLEGMIAASDFRIIYQTALSNLAGI